MCRVNESDDSTVSVFYLLIKLTWKKNEIQIVKSKILEIDEPMDPPNEILLFKKYEKTPKVY